nr:OB-fold nucleic acid binding domain-containing protein [Pseudomonas sp. PLB05]
MVVDRQRPGIASGVTFVTLEDEYGMVKVVVWAAFAEPQRRELVASQLLRVDGTMETCNGVLARRSRPTWGYISELLQGLDTRGRDFH